MQNAIYPLVPVICDDGKFAAVYNEDLMSSLYQSSCIKAEDLEKMIEEGVRFNQVVFVNYKNGNLIDKFKFDGQWNSEFMPEIVNVQLDEISKNGVGNVHRAIQNVLYNHGTG